MLRCIWSVTPTLFLVVAACGGATFRWRPSLSSQVPDSTPVRFVTQRSEPRVTGRALDWERRRPRLITLRGDTVLVPEGARLEVRLKEKTTRAVAGAVVGFVVGVGVMYSTCAAPRRYCGEQDPTPMLAAGLGALVGSRIKADQWIRVRWNVPVER
jgi:hypothetical protein